MTVERFDPPSNLPAMLTPEIDAWIQRLEPAIRLTELTYSSELIPASFRGRKGDVLAGFIRAGELKLSPFTGISQMHTINGRVGISAELMRALILRAGHDLHIERSDARACTIRGRRKDWAEDRWTTVTFTIEDAARAGLLEDKRSQNGKVTPSLYKKWPAALLLARASTILARMIFADVIAGLQSIEELQDMTEPGEWLEPAPPVTSQVSRQSAVAAPAVESEPQAAPGGAAPAATGGGSEGGAAAPEQPQAAAPARKKAPLRPRGKATAPAPVSDDAGPVEAEPVADVLPVDGQGRAEEPAPAEDPDTKARRGLITSTQMHFERLLGKPVDREERLWYTGLIVARPVESTNDLDGDELHKLLKVLERLRNREQLEALNQPAEGGEA